MDPYVIISQMNDMHKRDIRGFEIDPCPEGRYFHRIKGLNDIHKQFVFDVTKVLSKDIEKFTSKRDDGKMDSILNGLPPIQFKRMDIAHLLPYVSRSFVECDFHDAMSIYCIIAKYPSKSPKDLKTNDACASVNGETKTHISTLSPGSIISVPAKWTYSFEISTNNEHVFVVRILTKGTDLDLTNASLEVIQQKALQLATSSEDENRDFSFEYNVPLLDRETLIPASVSPLQHSSYIYHEKENLSISFCEEIIRYYELSHDIIRSGCTAGGVQENIKKTQDVDIARYNRFFMIETKLREKLHKAVDKYFQGLPNRIGWYKLSRKCIIPTIKLQRYTANEGFYVKHTDESEDQDRILVFMWYLNDVDEGGETVFYAHDKEVLRIKPKAGTLIIFPSTWTYPHCGLMPISSNKYICNGWVIS